MDALLKGIYAAFDTCPALPAFCPMPDDIRPQAVAAHHIPASTLFQTDTALTSRCFAPFVDALVAAAPHAHWRETYKGTDIGETFLSQFGCYGLIGPNAPWTSDHIRAWMVYMPAGLHYPWHHHPGEEIYLVLAGEAEFARRGAAPEILGEGHSVMHAKNQPHATTTHGAPLLALVLWRSAFGSPPVLSEAAELA